MVAPPAGAVVSAPAGAVVVPDMSVG
jgi:hypothetical protein